MMHDGHTLIHHFLEENARSRPDKIALIHDGAREPYARINEASNRLARFLLDRGVARGDRVALMMENCKEYVIGSNAVLKTGAIAAGLSVDLKPDGLRPILEELAPRVILSSARFEGVLKATDPGPFHPRALVIRDPKLHWADASFPVHAWGDLMESGDAANPRVPVKASDIAAIVYTSGSTGRPKGAMLSHRNIVANTRSIVEYLRLTDKDIQMCVLPFFYVMGKSLLNTHLAVGGTVVINNNFAFPASVVQQMVEERVTGFSGVPSTYAYLLHRSPFAKHRDQFDALRYCSQAGGHMSKRLKKKLREVLPGRVKIYIMYGATEASARLAYLDPDRFSDKIDSIGKAIPGVALRVLDENGREAPVGQKGELVARGDNIMGGYWKNPRATARVLDRHGYHTGDLCRKDEEGFFYLEGRKDDLLKVGGHRINPAEIEEALMETDRLMEVKVVGVRDELLGVALEAVAAPSDKACRVDDLLKCCAEKLPRYKIPTRIKLVRALPKNASGKIDKKKCAAILRREKSK
ncbi:MAG: acyl--CoA ligase [Desulfobacterales bacterium]|nr:acyl--CoA ligase [Desulfobacterales bacterium]